MEAIKAVIFNSPVKKTSTIYNHPSSRPSQSKAKVGQKQTSNNTRNNNFVGNDKKIHVDGSGLNKIKITSSGKIQQTQRPPGNVRQIGPAMRPSINQSSQKPSPVHQSSRQYVNQRPAGPTEIYQSSNQFVNQIAQSPTQIHQGLRTPVIQSSSGQRGIRQGVKPSIKISSSPGEVHQGSRLSVNISSAGPNQIYQGSKPPTNLGLAEAHPIARHPVRPASLASPSQNFVLTPPNDTIHNENLLKKKSLKKVVVPALYSLKELALKKKNMRQNPDAKNKSDLVAYESISAKQIKERQLLEKSAPFANTEVNKLVTHKELIQTVEDDDSDIEVEEIHVVSKPTQPVIAPSESGSNLVISTILKQVEDLENTLKNNVAKKDSELQVEKQIVEQLKKKNQILELRDKMRKEAMEEKDNEAAKDVVKKNKEIETLQLTMKSFSDSMAQKLTQKQKEIDIMTQKLNQRQKEIDIVAQKLTQKEKEIDTMQSVSKKNLDFMSRKVTQKQDELSALGKKYEKVSSELEDLQKWRSTQVFKEKEALTKLIQGNLDKDKIYKGRIEALEKNINEKDILISEYKQSIESLNVKIGERDGLVRNLKLKVNALVTEFSNGFKDKDEQINTKIEEVNENSCEIERLKKIILLLEKNISDNVKEIENKELLNKKQATINQDLLKKLSIAEHWMNLHSVKQQETEDIMESLEKINADYVLAIRQLQNKLSKLKTIQGNGLIIKDEDIFEDKLEQFMYNFYGKEKQNRPPMLTYSWPVFSIHVDPCLLQERKEYSKETTISQINIEGKPRMLTYLWPVLPFRHKRKISSMPSHCSRIPVSLPKMVEQIRIIDDIADFIDYSFDKKETDLTRINHNWPIVPFNEVVNRKRKFEKNIDNSCKKLKIDATGINHNWPIVPFNEVFDRKRKSEELIKNTDKQSQYRISADLSISLLNPVSLFKSVEQVTILDDVADLIDKKFDTKESDVSKASNNWPIVAFKEVVSRKRKFEDSIKTEVKRIKLDTELKSCDDDLTEFVSSILDNIFEYVGKYVTYLTSDIIADLVEKCETATRKDWPMISSNPNIFMNGTMNIDLKKCKNIKSKVDIKFCKGDVSRQEILQLFPSFQVRPQFFELPPKIRFVNKVVLTKCEEVIDNSWPVMIYQENVILRNLNNLKAALDHKDLDFVLKETYWECQKNKRKFKEGLDLVSSKRIRLHENKEDNNENVEEQSENLREYSENVVHIIYEIIDYVVSFTEIKRLLI